VVRIKALILSGGKGTRLRPITFTSAKQLVPIANKPILFYGIEAIRDAGITDVGIVVGDTADEVKKAVGTGEQFGIRVEYIQQEAPLGLAHAVKVSRDYLGDDSFIMYLGDNLLKNGVKSIVSEFSAGNHDAQILLARVPNPREFGVAEIKEGRVVALEEKPKKPKSDYALVGVYIFSSSIFEAVEHIKPSWRNELEITDAIQYLIDKGFVVNSHIVDGWWKDTGKLADILDANRMVLSELTADLRDVADLRFVGDGGRIRQVLLNFVTNAEQAIVASKPADRRIVIRTADAVDTLRVEVEDTGPGVAPEDESKLFQPFFTTKPVGEGTGLGLSVSYGIIRSLGGDIGYLRGKAGGALFYFDLPAHQSSST